MSAPVPLKKGLQLYHKGTQVNWLTSKRNSQKQIHVTPSKSDAIRWVVEQVGTHFTIRVMNTKNFLAAGSLKAGGDCTAIITASPTGMSHHWKITRSGVGIKISTVQPCLESGKKVVQYLKVSSAGGPHLELASRDSGTFVAVLPPTAQTPRPVTTKPAVTTPAPAPASTPLRITNVSQIPKTMAIESYLRPKYFVAPNVLPSQGREGSLHISSSRSSWFTLPSPYGISVHSGSIKGPFISVAADCSRPILDIGALDARSRFQIGTVSGYDGFVLRTSAGACADGKTRFLVTHSNGAIGVGTAGPTSKNIHQYLWRFSVGAIMPTPNVTLPSTPYPNNPMPTPNITLPSTPYPNNPMPTPNISSPETPSPPYPLDPTPTPDPNVFGPSPTPFTLTPTPTGKPDININIGVDPNSNLFPYPVAPDLLIGVNPDGEVTATPTPGPDATTEPATATEDEEVEVGWDAEEEETEEGADEGFWTLPRIGMALVAFILVSIAGYYIYKNMSGSGNKNTLNNKPTGGNNNVTPMNTSTNANLGNLGGNDAFGDGFDEFANVGNIGPPPPTTR